jgi:hypothetical protein
MPVFPPSRADFFVGCQAKRGGTAGLLCKQSARPRKRMGVFSLGSTVADGGGTGTREIEGRPRVLVFLEGTEVEDGT